MEEVKRLISEGRIKEALTRLATLEKNPAILQAQIRQLLENKIQSLISDGNTEDALVALSRVHEAGVILQNRYRNAKDANLKGSLSYKEFEVVISQTNYAILEFIKQIEVEKIEAVPNKVREEKVISSPSFDPVSKKENQINVFISYSSADRAIADQIRQHLQLHNFSVIIDHEAIKVGGDIQMFIKEQMRNKGFVISIVSMHSLRSGWVGMESNLSFYAEIFGTRQFIPVAIDNKFRDSEFIDSLLDEIDRNIENRKNKMTARLIKERGIEDLQQDHDRDIELRNNLTKIVQRLKNSFTIEINDNNFHNCMDKVIDSLRYKSYNS